MVDLVAREVARATPIRAPYRPVPQLRVFVERLLVDRGEFLATRFEEIEVPALELRFRYGDVIVSSSDPSDRFFLARGGALLPVMRDAAAESQAKKLLEGFGAVELGCLDDHEPGFDSAAHYVVKVNGDVHAYCAFGAYALPQLRRLGWDIEIDPDYPYQVLRGDTPWYASVEPEEGAADWFSLELAIEVDGQRIDLVGALVGLLDETSSFEALQHRKIVALPVGNGRLLPVSPERLMRVLAIVRELYNPGLRRPNAKPEQRLRFRREEAGALDELDDAVTGQTALRWRGDADARAFARRLVETEAKNGSAPPGLLATLRPYQEAGLGWLQHLREIGVGGILADDMGLGKTLQTIAHLATEKLSGRMDLPALIVAPTSLLENWRREIGRFAPFLRVAVLHGARRHELLANLGNYDVLVTTYGVVARDVELWSTVELHMVVLDEAQAIKNARSQSHQAMKALQARHRLCLSGTPVENSLGELWSYFEFLNPGFLGTHEQFRQRFQVPVEQGNAEQLERLRKRVSPFILRRVKAQVVTELPPKTEVVRPVSLEADQRELYESIRVAAHGEVRRVIRKNGLAAATIQVLDALMKLRQVCCDPRLLAVDAAKAVVRSAKYEAMLDLTTQLTAQGRRILVFSQFTSMLSLIGAGLSERGIRYVTLTGATANRQALVDDFQAGKVDVFLISLKAGGTGLNLTTADTIIHYDPWWNPAAQAQATDRAYRMGQKNPVFVYNLIVAGSVEERMLRLQERKRNLAASILEGAAQGPVPFDAELVEDLLAPLDC